MKQQAADIMLKLKEKISAILVDENTDAMGRYVGNVLMQPLNIFAGADSVRHVFAITKEEQTFIDILIQTEEDDVEGIFHHQPGADGVENQLETVAQINKQSEAMSKIVSYLKRSGLNGELTKAVYQENDTRWNS